MLYRPSIFPLFPFVDMAVEPFAEPQNVTVTSEQKTRSVRNIIFA